MQFRTKIEAGEPLEIIGINSRFVSIGSCFSQTIGNKLAQLKLKVENNPFGTIFHPLAISSNLNRLLQSDPIDTKAILHRDEVYLSMLHHSSIKSGSRENLIQKITEIDQAILQSLRDCNFLILTFGTSIGFHSKSLGQIVANCHKMPSANFEKNTTTVQEITKEYNELIDKLLQLNNQLKVILTVSPVRHIKNGLEDNSLSKSILRVAAGELAKRHASVHYFPSYEILIDDLRSYRFYEKDLIHPTDVAVDYVFEIFKKRYFNKDLLKHAEAWSKIFSSLQHEPFNPHSESHKQHLLRLYDQLKSYPYPIDFQNELDAVQKKLNSK